jgi:two-component system sensor histidine kinase KdpD
MSDTVLQSIANLAAIGLERAKTRESALMLDAAQRSGELRAALIDSVAHEFKTPLTSIRAAVDGLVVSEQTPAARELLAIIDEESARLQHLVADAIHMFRVEAGDFRLQRDTHRLRDLVDRAIHEIGPRAADRSVSNTVEPDLLVEADASLLGLALRQLLDNALKYSPPASPIQIGAACGDEVTIVVRNAGAPMPPHERDRIFERFYRGSAAAQAPGTGMGLAIVRQIARAHGGDVGVTSDADGVAIHLSLPLAAKVA